MAKAQETKQLVVESDQVYEVTFDSSGNASGKTHLGSATKVPTGYSLEQLNLARSAAGFPAVQADGTVAESNQSSGISTASGKTLYVAPNGDVYVNILENGKFDSVNYGKALSVPGFTATQVEEAKRKAGISTVTTKPTTNNNPLQGFINTVQRGVTLQLGGLGIGTPGFNPSIGLLNCPPGTPGYYRAAGNVLGTGLGNVMGGFPVAQSIYGSGVTNDQLRLQLNQANVAAQLAQGFQILAGIAPEDKKAGYTEVAEAFASGQLDVNKIVAVTERLKQLEFYKLQRQGGDSLAEMFYNLCSYTISGNASMISFCKGLLVLNAALPGAGSTDGTDEAKSAAALAEERKNYLNSIRAEGTRADHVNRLVSSAEKCSQYDRILGATNSVESSIKVKQSEALDLGTDEEALELIRLVEVEVAKYRDFYEKSCKSTVSPGGQASPAAKAEATLKLESEVYSNAKTTVGSVLCKTNLDTVKKVKENLSKLKTDVDGLVKTTEGSDRILVADLEKRVNAALGEVAAYILNCEKLAVKAQQQPGATDGILQISVAGNAKYTAYEISAFAAGLAATPRLESRVIPLVAVTKGGSTTAYAPAGKYKVFFRKQGLKNDAEKQKNTRSAADIEVTVGNKTCVVIYDSTIAAKVEPCSK